MNTLIVGASGATGKRLVEQLLGMGHHVRAIVRVSAKLPETWNKRENLTIIRASVTGMLHVLLPPHADNEQAADHLRLHIGTNNPSVEWVVVRPDTLIDQENVTGYNIHASPVRSALFDPGKTSRINVAHFMARLMNGEELWEAWKGQMPVIYNE